ncbi:MAG: RagB/SusD family nutrient uptake outer membrane protein [Tannerella sp.]|nr:RagB/SusD family nutrient uptake outer membrane protein [Tannerella sp.]
MKKNIFLIVVLITTILTPSCNDILELEYDGRSSLDELFATRNGVRGYLNSCYGHRIYPNINRSALTDESHSSERVFQGSLTSLWYVDAFSSTSYSNVDGQPWTGLYQTIRKCNIFLQRIESVSADALGSLEDEVTSWKAQAHTLRALYYLDLIKRYGNVPLIIEPYETTHDYGGDVRTPVSTIVKQILDDCDAAMSAPEMTLGFSWTVRTGENYIMNRAVVQAIRSQAILYAASPLYTDGAYSWSDAAGITGNALSNLLTHDYKLWDEAPTADIAQNAYDFYFITPHDEQRARDKETIYGGNRVNIWANHGMPSTAGQTSAGACPTQELVDCYEMQATGLIPITGYSDAGHLQPIINTASGYDPENPYEGRDPRFYATIYFNEAVRDLGTGGLARDDHYPLGLTLSGNNISVTDVGDGEFHIETSGGDPFVPTTTLGTNIETGTGSVLLKFKYKSNNDIRNAQFFFMSPGAAGGQSTPENVVLNKTDEWKEFELDLTPYRENSWWRWGEAGHALRFDVGSGAGNIVDIKDMEINMRAEMIPSDPCYTYVGGSDGIGVTDRRNTHTGYYLRKYNNWKSGRDNNADGELRMFRLAEMYLNFAEAAYQSTGSPDAAVNIGNGMSMSARDAVNAIRRRVGMPDLPAGLSKDEFEIRYRNERRVELAYEGHRYFDVRRWRIMENSERYVTGMRITQDGDGYNYERISFERESYKEKLYLYPIPQGEINKMQSHTGTDWQNPGWN